MGNLLQDLRYALRQLRNSPGFTVVAVITLALGIGANTAIFTMIDAVLWKMLPVKEPQELFEIATFSSRHQRDRGVPTPLLQDFLRESHKLGFSGTFVSGSDGLSLEVDGNAERVMGNVVTPNYFSVLGVKPFLGQMFSEDVVRGSWQPEVVLPYDFWQRRFHGDPAVVGRIVHLNGYAFTVVGVSPPDFFGVDLGISPEVRIPMLVNGLKTMPALPQLDPSTESAWPAMGRLKPGVSERKAQAMLDSFFRQLVLANPQVEQDLRVQLSNGSRGYSFLDDYKEPLVALMCLVGFVLLIACANLANLMLGRAVARQREIAVRLALGAGHWRLIRQLLTESVLLSLSGGMLGILLSVACTRLIVSFLPQTHIRLSVDLHPDLRVLGFTFVLAFVTAIVFGLAPALQIARQRLTNALKNESLAVRSHRFRFALREVLMVSQVVISVLLLVGAGLLVRSLGKLKGVDTGFSSDRVLLFTMKHVHERYTVAQITDFFHQLVQRVEALPGVRSASLTDGGPFSGRVGREIISVPRELGGNSQTAQGVGDAVGPGFFRTLGIPFLLGRDFTVADQNPSRKVAILNDVTAHDFFPTVDPIGRQVQLGQAPNAQEFEIIGVVKGFKYRSLKEQALPEVFVPMQGMPWMPVLAVRTSVDPNALIQPVLHEFRQLDKDLPVFNIKTMETQVDESIAPERLVATLAALFGSLATLLVSIGLYGVFNFYVTRRTREIGIRIALGAQPKDVTQLIVKQGMRLALFGALIGLVSALALTGLLSGLLYGVKPTDPITFAATISLLLGIAFLAAYIPARRAAKVDPMVALRYE